MTFYGVVGDKKSYSGENFHKYLSVVEGTKIPISPEKFLGENFSGELAIRWDTGLNSTQAVKRIREGVGVSGASGGF
jgi:hypothetical protein